MAATWRYGSSARERATGSGGGGRETQDDLFPPADEVPTKRCPRCGAELFADMDVCFDCLYDFARKPQASPVLPPLDDLDEPDSVAIRSKGKGAKDDCDVTLSIPKIGAKAPRADPVSMRILSPSVDITLEIPNRGLLIGRSAECDVVLHTRSVSRRHVRVFREGGAASVEDLGAKNAALLNGRELEGKELMEAGDVLDVCGTRIELA